MLVIALTVARDRTLAMSRFWCSCCHAFLLPFVLFASVGSTGARWCLHVVADVLITCQCMTFRLDVYFSSGSLDLWLCAHALMPMAILA